VNTFETADVFTDASLVNDPFPYFEYLRGHGPAVRLPYHDVVAVVDYKEALGIFHDDTHFSSVNAVAGPFPGIPFKPEGEDITAQIEEHRSQMTFAGLIATQDLPAHAKTRALMMGLITPPRLKDNEAFMWRLADRQIAQILRQGSFEVVKDFAQPFTTLVIADLLGVPEEDRKSFTEILNQGATAPGQLGGDPGARHNPLEAIGMKFLQYLSDRRSTPQQDVLSQLAQAKYQDGSTPELFDIVGIATFLFAAGQDTTTRLISSALRLVAEDPELQRMLRAQRERIPNFLEEVLRLEGTVKALFRLTKKRVRVGDLELDPGTTVMLIIGAADRDPKRFDDPNRLSLERKNARDHLAFGRGIHACAGAPLARAETRVMFERLFDATSDIRIDEAFHGSRQARRFEFEPTYMFRALKELHLKIVPVAGAPDAA
jgi:cytochrome P450